MQIKTDRPTPRFALGWPPSYLQRYLIFSLKGGIMLATTETILFAIKAGLRLYGAMRKAYVDGTRNRKLILPLPRSQGIDWDSAVTFFSDREDAMKDRYPRAVELAGKDALTGDEQIEILNIYLKTHT